MDIKKENIKVIITSSGAIFVGQEECEEVELPVDTGFGMTAMVALSNKKKLIFPFRISLDQGTGSLRVAAPLLKEEWILIDMSGAVECQVNPKIEEQYIKYCQQIFGGIIMPEEKRIII